MAVEHIYIFPAWGNGNDLANNVYKTYLDLPLRRYEESQLAITNIEGLAPVASTVNITQYAAKDGGIFNSSRASERHITVTMKLFKDPSMDAVRNKIYNYCRSGEPIGLVFEFSDGYAKAINGYVEDTPADYFGEQEGIQFAVACPNPNFIQIFIDHENDTFSIDFRSSQVKLPSQEIIGNVDPDFKIEFYNTIKDPNKVSDINSLIDIDNNLDEEKKILYAIGFGTRSAGLRVNFFSEKPTTVGEVDQFVDCTDQDVYDEDTYYHRQKDDKTYDPSIGYTLIESEEEFTYRTSNFFKLTQAEEFAQNKYYERSESPEPGIWIPVTWQAHYSDEQDPTMYDYPVRYGFLNNNLVNNEIVNSIVSIFDDEASYFSSADRMFFDLSKSGTPLPSAQTFAYNTYYKIARTYELINGMGGWSSVLDDDPIYFFDDIYAYESANGEFNPTLPLYGFYDRVIQYAVIGTVYVSGKFYYINANNEEVLVTGSQPSDWASSMVNKKYYEYITTFYGLTNYPGDLPSSDNTMLGGRYKYDVILDYLTYKYDQIVSQMAYEPNVYYERIGYAETELAGIYGLSSIPIYQLMTDITAPSDWGSSDKYFIRTKMTVLERPHELYFNDHAYHTITNRAVYRYELLDDVPDDWTTNYANYYTLADDYSNIIAYFVPDEYPNYEKLYSLLTSAPADFQTDYAKYYKIDKTYSFVYKKTGSTTSEILVENPDNIKAYIDMQPYTFRLGNENGQFKTMVFRASGDVYSPNTYYIYDGFTDTYELVTSPTAPEDWTTSPYRYYKLVTTNADEIEMLMVIFWNPASGQLEYDIDQYDMFLNDFDNWAKNALMSVAKMETTAAGNSIYYRNLTADGKYFKTYALAKNYIFNKENFLASKGKTYILANTIYAGSLTPYYNPRIVVGIASYT